MPLCDKLIELLESHADELTRRWLRDVRQHHGTQTFHTYPEAKLYHRNFNLYSHLGDWISPKKDREEIAETFMAMGRERRREGFALSELIQSLVIARRHLWLKVRDEGLLDSALSLYQAMDLTNCVILFFDRAMYYTAVGYERAAASQAA